MQTRPPGSGWVPRALLVAAVLPLLAQCGPARNQFAPVCPNQAILGDAANLNVYRASAKQGPSRDFTDLVVSGRIVQIHGSCEPGGKNHLAVAVSVNVELTRGPALQGNGITLPISESKSGAAYTLLSGFQMTPDQLRQSEQRP